MHFYLKIGLFLWGLGTESEFLLQPLVCGTVFHRTSLLDAPSLSSVVALNHISSTFLILPTDFSLICRPTVPHPGHSTPALFWQLPPCINL